MDLEDLEFNHPKCFLVTIGLGMIIELYILLTL